jgi:hypothetical protein
MNAHHGLPLRGLDSTQRSRLYQGRFGRMFRLPAAQYGKSESESLANLNRLGTAMTAELERPKDGKDEEESGIPSLYTYLGQFLDHDITFDPMSSLIKQNDPDALIDFRTPRFDLDHVYGRGPEDQPYLYRDGRSFLLGDGISGGSDPKATDLPRNNAPIRRALIGDPRNDENVIVSQLHGLFLRFHNRFAARYRDLDFTEIQKVVRFHYQYMVLNDFLPRIVHSTVLDDLKNADGAYDRDKLKFFRWKNEPFMPVEFSVAAYRFGHSMIRPAYRLNETVLRPIFSVEKRTVPGVARGLSGLQAMHPTFGIDWGRFIDVEIRKYDGSPAENKQRLQFAYRIDTSLVAPLMDLPSNVATDPPPSLPQRNLRRGFRLELPSGQQVASAMNLTPLLDEQILIGKGTDVRDPKAKKILSVSKVFTKNCPLWTYILAEAMQHKESVKIPVKENLMPKENLTIKTPKLGPVGGRIVAEVFLGLMFGDPNSLLRLEPKWQPEWPNFELKDFVNYALGNKVR